MMSKKSPQLRFEGFTDDWEERKLGNELTLLKDGTHGTHQNVLEGPLLLSAKNIKNGKIIIDEITDRKISVEEYNSIHKKFSLEKGDVLLTIVGSIGETAIIENPIGITFQRSVAYLRPSHTILSQFLFTTINGQKFQMELRKRQVVSAQPGIYLGDLSIIPILIPSVAEQEKIGSFFKQLDETIALHQRKLDLLKEQKKGYLQKMFPKAGEKIPELRFAGFADDWEDRKFSDFTKLSQGLQIAISDRFTEAGPNKEFYITNEFLNPNNTKKYYIENPSKNVIANTNDILMTRTGNTGKVVTNTKGAFHNNFFKIDYDPKKISKLFLYFLLTSIPIQKEILIRAGTSTIPDLNHKDFYKIKVYLPVFEEQQRIGSFFKQLDDTIALHQRKLDLLKEQKKGFLQKMFV
ncbi:restriction endonuclease subunit S [Lactococcus petauri]|uniref:restriction endonuclease subunit S n=1 Tax=Lactococcus petauri TaxID=1940789 RepID=UPI00232B6D6D|nr:restriction endonuclease subunit S [Lactococcus petauri]MDC0815933.1 restriction endonuclease subunit S [Lactococcus petauri]MDC0824823.1 restriction endonuclease subunit S [Lactococcus petauri]MDC0831331.1 restriction endonuclease subunit S [Lactococcus petauri]